MTTGLYIALGISIAFSVTAIGLLAYRAYRLLREIRSGEEE